VPNSPPVAQSSRTFNEEAYRVLRSNVNVAISDLERATVLVTSAQPGEGKTATSANLARVMALGGQRVVLADLDLRHPDVHRWFGVSNDAGVTDILLGRSTIDESLQYVEVSQGASGARGFYLLPTGPAVANPTELLGSRRMAQLLDALATQADIVVIDTPPVLPVADTLVIGRMAAGALLVVEARKTPVAAIQRAKDALTRSQTRLLGLVVNKMQAKDADLGYGYGYGYGYGDNYVEADGDGDGGTSGNGSPGTVL
jgi:capsular exopolysaccharide synthesis family protein